MKRILAVLSIAMIFSACAAHKSASIATNPQVKKDVAQAEKIVKGCVLKGSVLTKTGRTKVLQCVAPPGHTKAFETCVQKDVATAHYLTKKGRTAFYQRVAVCLEQNR